MVKRVTCLFHVIPVGDDTVLDRVLQGQDTTLGLGFISDLNVSIQHHMYTRFDRDKTHVRVLLSHADHDTLVTRATDDRRENS